VGVVCVGISSENWLGFSGCWSGWGFEEVEDVRLME